MSDLDFRRATAADLPAIVAMLADDSLGATREGDPDDESYRRTFSEIDADPHHSLIVGASLGFEPTHLGMKLAL